MTDDIDLEIGSEQPPLNVAIVAYPDLTLLDLIGPQTVFAYAGNVHVVSASAAPVISDTGLALVPTCTYAECPEDLDLLLVPGGRGAVAAMQDGELHDFLRNRAARARYVASVCSGSLVLGAAGLLAGRRSTCHWAVHDVLSQFKGVEPVHSRIVFDGDHASGGGVTAGIDFGLRMLAELRGEETAKLNQLLMEYDPQPPFDAGSPDSAGPELTGLARSLFAPYHQACVDAARASDGARV